MGKQEPRELGVMCLPVSTACKHTCFKSMFWSPMFLRPDPRARFWQGSGLVNGSLLKHSQGPLP